MNEKIYNFDNIDRDFLSKSMKSPLLSKDQDQSLTIFWKNTNAPEALKK